MGVKVLPMRTKLPPSPVPVLHGPFTEAHARRLLWRAGFGPRRGEAATLAKLGLEGAVASLTRPAGAAELIGAAPRRADGQPLDPFNVWGDDHCWWLDRMVRSTHQLSERMTLIWHSWFATSIDSSTARLMINQNWTMRGMALGNFHELLLAVTKDPAMLLWLNGNGNYNGNPNENYAREMMELFTLGADRGYTEADVHENALALTGWTNEWNASGPSNFRFEESLHDDSVKTIFGHRGRFDWVDSCRLCVEHPLHPSFMVGKLWSYFVPVPPPASTLHGLERAYVDGGFEVRPLVEAILRHPAFYEGPRAVIPPVVFTAGLLRALGETVTTDDWSWIGVDCGQRLFEPPNVAGWNYADWMDTARWSGRLTAISYALRNQVIDPSKTKYSVSEDALAALATALDYWDNPQVSSTAHANLLAFANRVQSSITATWEAQSYRAIRQNALRALIPASPDFQTC
jgi:uncharacterized protein (DUF1800 family)